MTVYTVDPLHDRRWPDLVECHPDASVFHTTAWLQVLRQTYGYQPVVFTTSPPGEKLDNGVVCCQIRSWLTGKRLVSLPFSDHCQPLVSGRSSLEAICSQLENERHDAGWDYVELRPRANGFGSIRGISASERFWFHVLDLQPAESALFAAFHKDSTQRKIRRAEREGLTYHEGCDERLLRDFYGLLLLTRRRHQLPPQPLSWFRNLAAAFGAAMKIRIARLGDRAVASMLTLRHSATMVYKYGASDANFHALGGMHLLFWKTIQEARATGCRSFDLGRCDTDNPGLATFKERWGARRSEIAYWRYAAEDSSQGAFRKFAAGGVKQVLGHAPEVCRVAAGRFLYRHAG
jgi:CelD/BcsL family acetyltransferase involved in cellulose biosynthesis